MNSNSRYADAQLRDLADSWVWCRQLDIVPPQGIYPPTGRLIGYLYVDTENGFRLKPYGRVRCGYAGIVVTHKFQVPWELDYSQLRSITLGGLSAQTVQSLGLPTIPDGILGADPERARCRHKDKLDGLRELGNPDIVRAWLRVGENTCGESVRILLNREVMEDVYEGLFLDQPQYVTGISKGDEVTLLELMLQGRHSLYCLSPVGKGVIFGTSKPTSDEV